MQGVGIAVLYGAMGESRVAGRLLDYESMTELAAYKPESVAVSAEKLQPQHGSLRTNWHPRKRTYA
jgi:hypothetical protein